MALKPDLEALRAVLAGKLADSLSGPLPGGTFRRVSGATSFPGKATAVIGPRRAGKTFFLHQLRRERLASGVPRERLAYVNFEDERLADLDASRMGLVVEEYYRRFPASRGRETVTFCLDEIQVIPGWERFVRRLLDDERVEIVLSGSSAALLGREIATAMRGRAWEVPILPFGFAEVLAHRGLAVPREPAFVTAAERSELEAAFLSYLAAGGFPEAQGLDAAARGRLLSDYVDVAMLRDVIERHGVTNVTGLRWLVRQLLGNPAALFSVERFFAGLKSQGIAISKDTVHALLAHLEDCFLVRCVWMESSSERQRMVNPRKAYPVDPALGPVFDRSGKANVGHALETAVLLELERRGARATYVRTPGGREVDFLARHPGGGIELIQVCADATDEGTAAREVAALEEARARLPRARARLLVLTRDGLPDRVPPGIDARPAYEWMLAGADGA
jgi:hypothetical protein